MNGKYETIGKLRETKVVQTTDQPLCRKKCTAMKGWQKHQECQ